MVEFKNTSDEKLERWLELYEMTPLIRTLFSTEVYRKAVMEAYDRFGGDEMYRNMYFVYINPNGVRTDYDEWYCRFTKNMEG